MNLPWRVPDPAPAEQEALCRGLVRELDLHPLVAALLVRRGIETPPAAQRFLRPSLHDLYDPFLLRGMSAAVETLAAAVRDGRRILVSGDYDVDGIASSALLGEFLTAAGCHDLELFIPNRFEHGYGLTPHTVAALLALRPKLVVTVDNGITAINEVAQLQAAGIETIITDHHLPRDTGLPAGIVVNPLQPGCDYPFKRISGCGVAFKLITALRKTLREQGWWTNERPEPNLRTFLDLVAVGTVADVVPLLDENRTLVWHGLQVLNGPRVRPGLAALLARGRPEPTTARTIAFRIAPRLNAAGRMAEGQLAVDLLLAQNSNQAAPLADRLEAENKARRAKGDEMLQAALDLIESQQVDSTDNTAENNSAENNSRNSNANNTGFPGGLVVYGDAFHEGIIGITATKLVERFQCPVLVLAENGESYKGSARSVRGINVTQALTACADLLSEYGGHAAAAGCRLPKDNLEPFRQRFTAACQELAESAGPPIRELDAHLAPEDLSEDLVTQLMALEPFGSENTEPRFLVAQAALPAGEGFGQGHLRWRLPGGGDMVAWGGAETLHPPLPAAQYEVTLGFNTYRGLRQLRLTVEAVHAGASAQTGPACITPPHS